MDTQRAAAERLVNLVADCHARGDLEGLAASVAEHWSPECLRLLFLDADADVRRAAAIAIGLIGGMDSVPEVAGLLHDVEEDVADAAEDALWSLWLRQGGPLGSGALTRITGLIRDGDTENIIPVLNALIRALPSFAEAYHQRSQAHYLEDNYAAAMRDALQTSQLNPQHFSAVAMQGHCLAAMGRFGESLQAYRRALSIHPRLPGVRSAIHQLRSRLSAHHDSTEEPAFN